MKGKLSSMWRVVIALVLVASLSLVMAAPVAASPDVSDVRVELSDYTATTASDYHIYFTPGVDLAKDVDTITILFPAGTTGMDSITDAVDADLLVDEDGDAIWSAPDATQAASEVAGYRVVVTTPVDIAAGTEARIDIIGKLTNPTTTTDPYQVAVWTSQETTHVDSASYTIGATSVTATGFGPATTVPMPNTSGETDPVAAVGTVGLADEYLVMFTGSNTAILAADWGTITITFPPTTTVPSSISADSVYVCVDTTQAPTDGDVYAVCNEAPVVDGRTVTVKTPAQIAANGQAAVYFTADAGIKNPTCSTDANNTNDGTDYVGKVYTSVDTGVQRYAFDVTDGVINAASASAMVFDPDSDTSVVVDVEADFDIWTIDMYGNMSEVPVAVDIDISSSSATGEFREDVDDDNDYTGGSTEDWTTTPSTIRVLATKWKTNAAGLSCQYKDSTVGTYILTASYGTWTPVTWDIEVVEAEVHVVELYDGDVLINTYDTIALAILDALAGNTIKVGPGTYVENLSVGKADISLESTDGEASTFIEGDMLLSADTDDFVLGGAEGKGFTLKGGTNDLIRVAGPDDVEISYNTLDTTRTPGASEVMAITMESVNVAGLTVTENSFIIADLYDNGVRGLASSVVSGLTITNNTFTGPDITVDNSAIEINTLDITTLDSTISGNEITNVWYGVAIGAGGGDGLKGSTTGNGTLEISGNTLDGCAYGIDLIDVPDANDEQNVVIKLNTFTSNTKGLAISSDAHWQPGDFTVKYNDFSGNTDGVYNDSTAVDATHNYWGDDTGPSGEGPGIGDAISTSVGYEPWLVTMVSAGEWATSATSLDAQAAVGVKVSGVDGKNIGAARYTENPMAAPEFTPLEDGFFDVYVSEAGTADEIGIKFYDAALTSDSVVYVWDAFEEVWAECSDQAYNATYGYIWVKVRTADATVPTVPLISELAGTPFAISTEEAPPVTLESIAASPSDVTLSVDGTQQLTVTATYSDLSEVVVTAEASYVSDDETVATVSAIGLITAVAEGSATVTASYTEGGITETDTVSVTVTVFDPWDYDADEDGVMEIGEVLTAISDYFAELIEIDDVLEVIVLYFS